MPVPAITVEEAQAGRNKLFPELLFLLSDKGVSPDIIAYLGHVGVTDTDVFAKSESTEAAMRAWIEEVVGLKAADGVEARMQVAKLLVVWERARERVQMQSRVEAEQKAMGQSRQMMPSSHLALRRAYVGIYGAVEDAECPGRHYLDMRFEQLEDGELIAESLSMVTTVKDEQDSVDVDNMGIKRDGTLHLRKGKKTVEPPQSPEQLRKFYRVMQTHWAFVALKDKARPILKDYSPGIWDKHVNYLLGEDGWGLEAKADDGVICARPSWGTILSWEFELRKRAMKYINEDGSTLEEALKAARKDNELRTKHLIAPVALSAQSRKRGYGAHEEEPPWKKGAQGKGSKPKGGEDRGGKGGGKDRKGPDQKGKGKGKAPGKGDNVWFNRWRKDPALWRRFKLLTPDNKQVCFSYQKGHCDTHDCDKVHVCCLCGGSHPFQSCTSWKQ